MLTGGYKVKIVCPLGEHDAELANDADINKILEKCPNRLELNVNIELSKCKCSSICRYIEFYILNGARYYRYSGTVEKRDESNSCIEKVYLTDVKLLNVIQRRKYSRATIRTDIDILTEHDTIKSQTLDIGGGGISVVLSEPMENNLEVGLVINIGYKLSCSGKIVNCIQLKNRENSYKVSIEFINMSELQRDEIINFMFKRSC